MKYKVYIDIFVSLCVAAFAYFILNSTGVIEKEGLKISGGIVIYFLNFCLMHKFGKETKSPIHTIQSGNELKITPIPDRDEYSNEIVRCIKSANNSIILLMRSLKSSKEDKNIQSEVASIRNAIKETIDKTDGKIEIMVITGSNEEYLQDGYELKNISECVHVYYSRSMRTSDLSAVIVDGHHIVIGFSPNSEDVETRSKSWVKGESVTLNSVLYEYADKLKQNSYTYEKFISLSIERMLPEHNDNLESVCKLLGLPNCELTRLKNA